VAPRQALCALEGAAADLWSTFECGVLDDGEIASSANGAIARIARELVSIRAIEPLSSEEGIVPVSAVETLALGDVAVLFAFADEALRQAVMPAFANLRVPARASDEQVMVLRRKAWIGVARRGEPVTWGKPDETVPLLKIALTEVALERVEGLALHAATLLRGGRAMLLLGKTGAGKSTLSLGLHGAGFVLAGDDLADLRYDGTVRAVPFAVTLKRGAWQLLEDRHGEVAAVETFRRPDGKKARYLPIDAGAAAASREVGWIVVLDRRAGTAPVFAPISPAETFAALIKSAWSGETDLDAQGFAGFAACIDGARCVRFTYSDLDAAADALRRLCGDEVAA
jgi:hypothetical protein